MPIHYVDAKKGATKTTLLAKLHEYYNPKNPKKK